MNSAADDDAAFVEGLQRQGTSAPTGAKIIAASSFSGAFHPSRQPRPRLTTRKLLSSFVARPCKCKNFTLFEQRNLGNQMCRGAETINTKFLRVICFPVRSVSDHASAKKRRDTDVVVLFGQRKTKSRIGDRKFRVAAIDCVTGNRALSQRFSRPDSQNSHFPHVQPSHGMPTRSPIRNS